MASNKGPMTHTDVQFEYHDSDHGRVFVATDSRQPRLATPEEAMPRIAAEMSDIEERLMKVETIHPYTSEQGRHGRFHDGLMKPLQDDISALRERLAVWRAVAVIAFVVSITAIVVATGAAGLLGGAP